MEINVFLAILKRNKQTIFAFVLVCFLVSGFLTIIQPFMYKTESRVLVYQDNIDPYAMSKSGQYLSALLTNVVVTGSFYEEVINSGYNINVSYFSSNEDERAVIWKNTVSSNIIDDSGVFRVDVYHTDRYQSKQIAEAINYVLKTKHSSYHGASDNVTVKIIDSPISSNYPVRPRFLLNPLAGIVCGLILSLVYIYLFPEDKYMIKIIPTKKEKLKTTGLSTEEMLKEKKQNAENAEQIRQDIQKALNVRVASHKEGLSIDNTNGYSDVSHREKQGDDIQNEKRNTFDISEIEETGSMNNIVGFSNLGR